MSIMENKEIFKTKFEYTWEEYKKGQMYNHKLYWYNVLFMSIIEILMHVYRKSFCMFLRPCFLALYSHRYLSLSLVLKQRDLHLK